MSRFVTRATETIWSHKACAQDWRGVEVSFQPESEHEDSLEPLWPRSRLISAGGFSRPLWWEYPSHESGGARSCYVIEGYTQDENGNPLDGCTVRAFTAADGVLQAQCVSNSRGFYRMGTYDARAHMLLANKGGAPDLAGQSNDDVMPA